MARPQYEPTPKDRKFVETLASIGTPQAKIAEVIGVDEKTLRKHFRQELDSAALMANAAVAQTLFDMATSGDVPAASIFWAKARMGWREKGDAGNDDGGAKVRKIEWKKPMRSNT